MDHEHTHVYEKARKRLGALNPSSVATRYQLNRQTLYQLEAKCKKGWMPYPLKLLAILLFDIGDPAFAWQIITEIAQAPWKQRVKSPDKVTPTKVESVRRRNAQKR